MDTVKNNRNIEKESLELVLEEFAEDQKLHTKSIGDLVSAINTLSSKFKQLEDKLEKPKEVAVSVDSKEVEDIVKKGITDIKLTVATQPKNVVREFSLHLFPKLNIMEYYRTYSRLVLFSTLFLVAAGFVSMGLKWIEGYNQRQEPVSRTKEIEKRPESAPRSGGKRTKPQVVYSTTDTLNNKQAVKFENHDNNTRSKKLLVDSLKNEIKIYLSSHKAGTNHQ